MKRGDEAVPDVNIPGNSRGRSSAGQIGRPPGPSLTPMIPRVRELVGEAAPALAGQGKAASNK
jgi:hypothetical protein